MVSHSDEFGVGTPDDSVNLNSADTMEDGIFAELQRQMLGAKKASFDPSVDSRLTGPIFAPAVAPAEPAVPLDEDTTFADSVSVLEREAAIATGVATPSSTATPLPSRRALREQAKLKTNTGNTGVQKASRSVATVDAAPPQFADEALETVAATATVSEIAALARKSKPAKQASISKVAKQASRQANGSKATTVIASKVRRTGRVATMVAMAFIAGLAVATSLPANALLTQAQIQAINSGLDEDGYSYNVGQEVQAGNGTVASGRDKVSATQWGGVLGGGLYSNVSYVNNPLGTIQWPFRRTVPISDLFGTRANPFGSGTSFHHGMDFNPGEGAPTQAIADGVVSLVVKDDFGGLGWYVIIDHNVNGQKFQSVYGHLKANSIQVRLGQRVQVTDIVGQVGNTGASTGAHLHFEIRIDGAVIDPLAWLQKYTN